MSAPLKRRSLLAATAAVALPLTSWAEQEAVGAAVFFKRAQMVGALLSPDGKRLAMQTVAPHGRVVLSVLDLATLASSVAYSSDAADVGSVLWVNSDRLAFTLADLETAQGDLDAGPGLFAVNHDGSEFKQLVERQTVLVRNPNGSRKMEPWNTFLFDSTQTRTGNDIYVVRPEAIDQKEFGYIKLLRLNTKTVEVQEIEGPQHSVAWWTDTEGALRVVLTRQGEKSALRWKDPSSGHWRVISEFNTYTQDPDVQVRHIAPDGTLYVTARRGRDKECTWLLNPVNGEWSAQPLAQSPLFDVDANVIARSDKVLGLRFTIDAEVTQWLDTDMQSLQAQIDKVLAQTINRLSIPWQADSPWVLIEAFSDRQPLLYLLFNRTTGKFTRLGARRPDIDPKKMASTSLMRFKAGDGLEIPAWLTLPAGADKKNLPLVVLVHGGPFVRAGNWRWDAEVQFLAARGYAVLQPEFRGTLGLGLAHYRAGWKQWGKAMQTDVAEAARWAINQGIADPKRVAIAGASYGGYATLMGLVRNPDLFQCGVAWVGVTELDMLYSVDWDDISGNYKRYGMPRLLGDRVLDAADLKENSPLTHARAITQPVLLAYGEADTRVPIVHGSKFKRAVQTSNHKVEWVVYEREGHGWRVPANQIDFWNRTAIFLDSHLADKFK